MTQQEFNERIGREITIEEYEYANGMYMSAGNVDKDTFCKDYKALMQNKSARAIFDELLNERKQRRGGGLIQPTEQSLRLHMARRGRDAVDRKQRRGNPLTTQGTWNSPMSKDTRYGHRK